ncbi:conserved hypothetical protein [Coccidioides posadasii str. Silveira]|uniref:Uncharacterized protein n=1 Tax=Coccidioides posadasii (strain RMSCC 757 / Silveira) TaxID=443226 RepID=E9CVC5_COCPS|nr:conserved hypothetical protein [Coccidioides posadasii str. Silveira]
MGPVSGIPLQLLSVCLTFVRFRSWEYSRDVQVCKSLKYNKWIIRLSAVQIHMRTHLGLKNIRRWDIGWAVGPVLSGGNTELNVDELLLTRRGPRHLLQRHGYVREHLDSRRS